MQKIMQNKSPLSQYQALVSANQISFDVAQQQAVELLQQLYVSLLSAEKNPISKSKSENKLAIPKGIYLWGKVGRGKTFLMDLFVNSLSSSFDAKIGKRQHFHHFMQDVHTQLNRLSSVKLSSKKPSAKQNPLKLIAEQFAKQYKVLCFDEFFVSDIGDAMLLGNLLQYLFELNVVVICTSNCVPQELYKNGLQRERFLPAIAAIEQHTQILHLSGEQDHRHRALTYQQNYFVLANTEYEQIALHQDLLTRFYLNGSDLKAVSRKVEKPNEQDPLNTTDNQITVLGRQINYVAITKPEDDEAKVHAICFEFGELCQGARSHFDYVEIAKQFSTIILFNVPPMSGQSYERIKARGTEDNGSNINVSSATTGEREVVLAPMDDAARRFIALVDECYDGNVNLVISAYVPQSELYNSGTLMFEFERTKSRLVEMASKEYWEQI
jgi:cell division protein ZapE